ncbi:MAG: transporter substrate-binding domain-containing protein [Bacteriovoracaceae bacterium]|nr:transporter substrate-binding domain-containing protein [Bacteriovoracaceae bacterium]
MQRIIILFVILILSGLIHGNTLAKDKIIFGTFFIPYRVINEDQGNFIDLTKIIARKTGLNIKIIMKPAKRTRRNFKNKKIDVIFPGLDVFFTSESELIGSYVFDTKNDYVFTRRGEPLLKTIKDLEGKKIGITSGYPYQKKLINNPLINFKKAETDIHNVRKLFKKRIDAFICEENSGLTAFIDTGMINKVQYDPDNPLSKLDVFYAFQNDEKGKKLAKIVSKALKEMDDDGSLKKLMYPKIRMLYKSISQDTKK